MNTTDKSSKLVTTTRAAARTVLVVALLGLTACGSSGSGGRTAASTATSSAASTSPATSGSTTPTSDQYGPLALQILDAVVRGDFNAATAHFDSKLHQELPPDQLGAAWATYQDAFGKYQSHGDPTQVPVRDLTVVSVPLQMERKPGEFRASFQRDGTVAGIYFLETGTPYS